MATAKILITGEDRLKAPIKQAQNDLTALGQTAQKVGKMIDTASVILAIVAAVKALTNAVSECVNEFKEQIEVETRLNAVIKATSQQYKYTAQDIKQYAEALQSQTRFADDAIESAGQLLVATKKFSKEGLERTLELSADLAEAMGTDITSAAQTLSKALIEPGEGLNRLKTVGISFTDAEEDMIKSLREAGDELGAQQIILDKVEASYAGVAKSVGSINTSTLDKISMVWSDLKEDIGNAIQVTFGGLFDFIYDGLVRLERLAKQIVEKANFNKYLANMNVQALADNFTTEYLQQQLDALNFGKNSNELKDTYKRIWEDLRTELEIGFDEFIRMDKKAQRDILLNLYPDNPQYAGDFLLDLHTYVDEPLTVMRAIEKQLEDIKESESKANTENNRNSENMMTAVIKGMDMFHSLGVSVEPMGKMLMDLSTGTVGPSSYMNSMFGQVGEMFLNSQDFMLAFYEWESDFDVFIRKFGEPDRQSGMGFNFGVASPDFLPKLMMDFTDTMSVLGPENVRKYLDFGDQKLQDALKTYGAYSESYQADLLQENINGIQDILDNLIEPGTALYQYFEEILRGLKSRQAESSSGSSSGGAGSGLYSWGEKFKSDMEELDKEIQNTLFEDFKSQLGEAGDLIDRLGKNMAQFGPLIGAIVTALHYVIEGFVQQIGPILQDFVQWGLEPLREFGRMIGQIITPILEEIMPSVIATGKMLMNLFGALARLLTPIVETLMRVIGPVLSVLADVIVSIVGTISWAIDWLAYAITWVLNKITFGWVQQSANPGGLSDYLSNMYADPTSSYSSAGMNSTGTTNASYTGGTVIHLNIYQNGIVCGDNGILEFATMIKNELADVAYYGR